MNLTGATKRTNVEQSLIESILQKKKPMYNWFFLTTLVIYQKYHKEVIK